MVWDWGRSYLALPHLTPRRVKFRVRRRDLQKRLHIAVDIPSPHVVRLLAARLGEHRARLAGGRVDEVAVAVGQGRDGEREGGEGKLHRVLVRSIVRLCFAREQPVPGG